MNTLYLVVDLLCSVRRCGAYGWLPQPRRRVYMKSLKGFATIAGLAMAAFTFAPQASATAELKISDGTNTVDILDGAAPGVCVGAVTGCSDANGSANQVTFVGTIGTW